MHAFQEPEKASGILWSLVLLVASLSLYACILREPKTPGGIPWIGRRQEPLSYFRAKIRMLIGFKEVLLEAVQHHKDGHAVLCALPIGPPQVVLPPKQLHWITTQPATVVSQDPLVDNVHRFLGSGLDGDLSLADLLRKELARDDNKIAPVYDEIAAALDDVWGKSGQWTAVDLKSTLHIVNARIANRIFVGLPLCRNDVYLQNVLGFTGVAGIGTAIYPLVPRLLKPVVSLVIKIINRRYTRRCSQFLLPVVRERFALVEASLKADACSRADFSLPDDLVTWLVKRSVQLGETAADLDARIVTRLVVANLPAIEATTNALWKSVSDLLLLADCEHHLMPLMQEAAHVLKNCGPRPSKQDVAGLTRVDRAIKETLRRESLVGLSRQITAFGGVDLGGAHLPHGTIVCISAVGLHFNKELYTKPDDYNPCREDRLGETTTARATDSYLSFGFGRRACPGRFLVTDQMKLIIAYIFTKYEIEAAEPKSRAVGSVRIRRKIG